MRWWWNFELVLRTVLRDLVDLNLETLVQDYLDLCNCNEPSLELRAIAAGKRKFPRNCALWLELRRPNRHPALYGLVRGDNSRQP